MKKLAFILVLLSSVFPVYSQSSDVPTHTFSLGIISGLNFSDMRYPYHHGNEDQRITTLVRWGAGAVLDIRLSDHLSVRLEPMYLQKGEKIEEGIDPFNQPEARITSSSIEIPLLIKYTFGTKIQPYLIGGPTLAYNLKSNIDFDITGLKFTGDLKRVTETFDFGVTGGFGLQVPLLSCICFFEGRYAYGLMNQRKSGTVTVSSNGFQLNLDSDKEEDKCMNRGLLLMVGISIPLGGH